MPAIRHNSLKLKTFHSEALPQALRGFAYLHQHVQVGLIRQRNQGTGPAGSGCVKRARSEVSMCDGRRKLVQAAIHNCSPWPELELEAGAGAEVAAFIWTRAERLWLQFRV